MFFRLIGLLVVIGIVGFFLLKSSGGNNDIDETAGSAAHQANKQAAVNVGVDTTDRVKAGKQLHKQAGGFMQQQEEQRKQMEAVMGQ